MRTTDASASDVVASLFGRGPTPGPCAKCGEMMAEKFVAAQQCEKCQAAGKAEADRAARLRAERSTLLAIPASHRWAHVDAPELRRLVSDPTKIDKLRGIVGEPMVTFMGPAGAGKTSLATALFRLCVENMIATRDLSMLYTTSLDIVDARKHSKLGERDPALIADSRSVDLLLIDDLGQEHGAFAEVLIEIIHRRHRHEKQTIVTSALTAAELGERYGGGIQRRLVQAPSVAVQLPPWKGKPGNVGRLSVDVYAVEVPDDGAPY